MKRVLPFLLLFSIPGLAEDSKPPNEAELQSAARSIASEQESVRESARHLLLTAGTAALPALRAELKQISDARGLSRLASVIELLDVSPNEREVKDSIGPFGLGTTGRAFATYDAVDSVLINSGRSGHFLDPGEGDPKVQPRPGTPVERVSPTFLGPECIAIPKRNQFEIAIFEPGSGESLGSLVLKTPEGKSASPLLSILRLDDLRFVTVREESVWVQTPLGNNCKLTMGQQQARINSAVAQASGIVALYREPYREIARWNAQSLKLEAIKAAPLDNADLMHAARNERTVLVGSSASASIAISTSDSLEFGKPRASGFGPGDLSALAVSPDGAWVAMGNSNGEVRIRLSTTWEQLVELNPGGKVTQLAFSDDGTTMGVQAGEKLHLYGVRHR